MNISSNLCQLDGNITMSSNEDEEDQPIPVQLGHRPAALPVMPRAPVRRTVRRSNKLVDALSAPRITLYNVRSAWSKWSSLAEDIDMRETDVCFLTEVWEKSENKQHQKAIESMLELKGIKYVSTPRPGVRRGGGTALACSEERFHITKLNIQIPRPLEACFTLIKPKNPTGKTNNFICCSFYSPPRSKFNNKLAEFLTATIGTLRTLHPGSRVILAGDINDMKLGLLQALDPTLKQTVKGFTNKNQNKTLDVFLMDCPDLYQEPEILPPMSVDLGKTGKDSDHNGVEAQPRSNLVPEGSSLRQEITVQPFPESGLVKFGSQLAEEDWSILMGLESTTEIVEAFETHSKTMVDNIFPSKTVLVGPQDLPYFSEELRSLKRRRQRAYRKGKKSINYKNAKDQFEAKKLNEAIKYRNKIVQEVQEGRRGSGYRAIRRLGDRPGERRQQEVILPAFVEQGLSPQQAADRLADHFSAISQTVDKLDLSQFHPALRLAIEEGRSSTSKPVLTQHQVYRKMLRVTKPSSSVPGDVPMQIMKEYTYEYAQPASIIFNEIIKSAAWPRQWLVEQSIVLSKSKTTLPRDEDELRTISKTQWLSKSMENILGDYILPIIDQYLDPGQCGGLKNSSTSHYLVKLLDFIHQTMDKRSPHCAVLSVEDLSKAYNCGSHQMVIEYFFSMHITNWILAILCSYLSNRSMILSYQKAKSSQRPLPGGFGAGTFMGGLMFIVKFNGACLRPPIPRPISGNRAVQFKFIDDSSKVASINLKVSVTKDPNTRPRPYNYHERFETILKPEHNILQSELDRFHTWTELNKLSVSSKKCFVMQFSRSKKYNFAMDFTIGESDLLQEKSTLKILGILIQSDLRWDAQVLQMIARARKTSWVFRRMRALGVDKKTLVAYWKAEGRVHLEMCCGVWHSSLTVAQRSSLEKAQRVAMAAMVGHWAPSLTDQLEDLGLERLFTRREDICRRFALRTASKSRHRDIFTLAPNGLQRPNKKSLKYAEPKARTTTYRKSAVPYLTRILNSIS